MFKIKISNQIKSKNIYCIYRNKVHSTIVCGGTHITTVNLRVFSDQIIVKGDKCRMSERKPLKIIQNTRQPHCLVCIVTAAV